jgi:hypothetical protein
MGAHRRLIFRGALQAGNGAPAGVGIREIDLDQSCRPQNRGFCAPFEGIRTMTTETILIVGAITAAFAAFALTLWRAERLTRDIKRE